MLTCVLEHYTAAARREADLIISQIMIGCRLSQDRPMTEVIVAPGRGHQRGECLGCLVEKLSLLLLLLE